jgi:hypothetical protein
MAGYVNVTDPELACWSTSTKSELTYPVQAGSTVTTTWKHYEYPAAVDYWPSGHAGSFDSLLSGLCGLVFEANISRANLGVHGSVSRRGLRWLRRHAS